MIWREKRVMVIVASVLLLANVLFFFTYRVQYQERVDDTRGKLDQAQAQLEAAKARRVDLEAQLEAHDVLVATIDSVFDEWWSTPDTRLTKVIVEVQSLGGKSGLVPQSMSFDLTDNSERMGTATMGITFNVEGTYEQVRQLINLIELSDEFLIIDRIGMRTANENRLTLNLALKTLFRGEAEPPKPVVGG